jgi:hypothetical protein
MKEPFVCHGSAKKVRAGRFFHFDTWLIVTWHNRSLFFNMADCSAD